MAQQVHIKFFDGNTGHRFSLDCSQSSESLLDTVKEKISKYGVSLDKYDLFWIDADMDPMLLDDEDAMKEAINLSCGKNLLIVSSMKKKFAEHGERDFGCFRCQKREQPMMMTPGMFHPHHSWHRKPCCEFSPPPPPPPSDSAPSGTPDRQSPPPPPMPMSMNKWCHPQLCHEHFRNQFWFPKPCEHYFHHQHDQPMCCPGMRRFSLPPPPPFAPNLYPTPPCCAWNSYNY